MSEQELQRVRDLLYANEVEEARTLLQQMNHPMADSWLERLDAKHPPRHRLALDDGEIPSVIRSRLPHDEMEYVNTTQQISGNEAARRYLEAMTGQQRAIGGMLLAVIFLVMMAFMQGFGFALLLILIGGLAVYLSQVEEVTTVDPASGIVERQYYLGEWVHYEIKTEPTYRLAYQGHLPPALYNPPSVSALMINLYGTSDDENTRAVVVLQSTLLAMWAWGLIEFEAIPVHHELLGVKVWDTTHMIVVSGEQVSNFDVDGDLERTILTVLERWPNIRRRQAEAWPWKPGPTVNELLRELTSSGLAERILQTAQQDAIGRGLASQRGWRRRFEFDAEGLKALQAEAHNLQVLIQYIAHEYPEVVRMVTTAVADVIGGIEVRYTQ